MQSLQKLQPWDTIFPPVPGGELTDEDVKAEFGHMMKDPGQQRLGAISHYIAMEARMKAKDASKLKEGE